MVMFLASTCTIVRTESLGKLNIFIVKLGYNNDGTLYQAYAIVFHLRYIQYFIIEQTAR